MATATAGWGRPAEALSVGLLRSLDVPRAEAGRVLAGEDGVLGGVRDRMEADLARRRRTLVTLDRILAGGLPQTGMTLMREPACQVVTVREVAAQDEIGAVTSACAARLIEAAGPPEVPLFGLLPPDLSQRVELAAAAEMEDGPDLLPGGVYA
ncbi:hypothetical protein ABZ801_40815 [Actinomadura sp. NPDC047616]|uniref:hypothetical protein n=1 Tax=Actinomadura sp. NPDC047616 TaxID=3155914 RepID=UPI0033D603C7